ncbi:tripartite tricarboxylate transporter substrate binding protein [Allopusillimonas soli]|uniref:Tripartite tricarboxylate transporter substrate binding protein n=1 Tax=Allopusillimonas soli TaxID=659016 RepID=A0A853FJ18_9BURK|nr:tripartite tricarboxylate transporter substrate binding protein [Allopusillimonas soli]NYT38740.1 tripartite tricarboxylate transporter substrate binding protein [Allopusillimonas soli]TEA70276.1 tripartite tricarboxylate transporter substrate binding protein [Allopusillimonas soli]
MKIASRNFALPFGLAGALLSALLPGAAGAADAYPSRPLTIVVGYSAGGATDILTRLVAQGLSKELGQSVIVENKAGANSNIGAEYVARSKTDGYTLYVGTIANTINRALYKNLSYDFVKDFKPIGMMAMISNVLVVNSKSPIKSVAQYIDYAKAHPGKLTCASSGVGSSIHMSCELFKIRTGTDILHVPYRGSGPAKADLIGGQVDSMFDNLPSSLSHIKSGELRALATTTAKRTEALPDVPTFAEAGVKDFVVHSWFGLAAPSGTPDEIVHTLNTALNKVLQSTSIKQAYEKNGFSAPEQPNSSTQFSDFIQSEIATWADVVKKSNIKVQ